MAPRFKPDISVGDYIVWHFLGSTLSGMPMLGHYYDHGHIRRLVMGRPHWALPAGHPMALLEPPQSRSWVPFGGSNEGTIVKPDHPAWDMCSRLDFMIESGLLQGDKVKPYMEEIVTACYAILEAEK